MADSPVLYVYYRPDNDDAYPGVPARHITEADWARFSPSQRRTVQEATTQDGYGRRKVWVHIDLVDETEQERAEREAREQAAREAYERGQSIVRWRDFEPLVPGPGEVIVGSADGPVATPVEDIGGDPNAVIGMGVRRIVTSFDPNHPLEDGDLLVLLEATNFFTDFSDYNAANWSSPWGAATWTVADDAGATGGKVLRGEAATAARISHLWQSPGTTTDAEIVFKWRASVVSANVTGFLRAGGTAGAEVALIAGYNHTGSHNVRLGGYNNGSWVSLGTTPAAVPVQANTWMVTRMRVSGTTLAFKSWLASDPEPGAWERQEATPSSISSPGMVGFGFLNPATVDFDWVGVAFDGAAAPKAGE